MAVSVNDRYIRATASAAQTVFTYDFPIAQTSDITILKIDGTSGAVTTLVYSTNYTLTGVGDDTGGTFVLTAGATANDIYVAYGATPIARATDFTGNTQVTTDALNTDYNEEEKQIQQNNRDLGRSLRIPLSDDITSRVTELPSAATRANKYPYFDASGDLTVSAGTGGAANAGGSDTEIQYNNAGILDGDANHTTDGAGNVSMVSLNLSSSTTVSGVIDDDTMATASATTLATSESIKAYVDSGAGGVTGPGSSTDNTVARFDGTSGNKIQGSSVVISDTDAVSGVAQLDVDNIRIDANTISSTNTNGNITITPNGTGITDFSGSTEAVNMPVGTTAQRPAAPAAGYVRFNTTTSTLETYDGSSWITQSGGSGDVTGPGSSTDNAMVRFDGTGGTLIQNSGIIVDDSNNITGANSFELASTKSIVDGAGLPYINFVSNASAVNYLKIQNSATANSVAVDATGSDTNVYLQIKCKGAGSTILVSDSGTRPLRIGIGTPNGIDFILPTLTADRNLTFTDANVDLANVAKAWVRFTGVTTTTIVSSNNVSSLTDNGTGDTTINFTTAFTSSTSYGGAGSARTTGTISAVINFDTFATGSVSCYTVNMSGVSNVDTALNTAVFFGT